MDINEQDWSGWLVRPKPEWLNPGEQPKPRVVLEDRGPRIVTQVLPQYRTCDLPFYPTECFFKYAYEVIDKEIQNYENA